MLQHLLGDDVTVPPDRGLFLAETWRLRPELCDFTSDAYYEGRLGYAPTSRAAVARRGERAGLAPGPAPGRGASRRSRRRTRSRLPSRALVGTPFTDDDGSERPLTPGDVLVVAPYNAQVRTLRSRAAGRRSPSARSTSSRASRRRS